MRCICSFWSDSTLKCSSQPPVSTLPRRSRGARQMNQLISDLHTHARIGRQGELKPIEVGAVRERSLRQPAGRAEESQAVVTAAELPTIRGVRSEIVLLFQNLIENAVKFRGDTPPTLHIDARREGDQWLFWLRNNGIGIEPQYLERIFGIGEPSTVGGFPERDLASPIVEKSSSTTVATSGPSQSRAKGAPSTFSSQPQFDDSLTAACLTHGCLSAAPKLAYIGNRNASDVAVLRCVMTADDFAFGKAPQAYGAVMAAHGHEIAPLRHRKAIDARSRGLLSDLDERFDGLLFAGASDNGSATTVLAVTTPLKTATAIQFAYPADLLVNGRMGVLSMTKTGTKFFVTYCFASA